MGTVDSTAAAFADDLGRALAAHAATPTREWWERYLKGTARFRGVRMADIRRVVNRLVGEHGLADADAATWLAVARACFGQPLSEDKLGGVLLLAEHGLSTLRRRHVENLAAPLAAGHLADWNTCDWYCVKVLGPFVAAAPDPESRARAVAGWRDAPVLWQRRAAAVAFVDLAGAAELFDGFTELLLDVCRTNVSDDTRWSQTSVGWLLRELSDRRPEDVQQFVDAHPQMRAESRRAATARLRDAGG